MPVTAQLFPATIDLATDLESPGAHQEQVQVRLPGSGVLPKIDVYFLTDSTGSMGGVIGAVRDRVEEILNRLVNAANSVGADVHFGVGDYKDMEDPQPERFRHQVPLGASPAAATAGIRTWAAAGGGSTGAEGQFYALDQLAQPPGGSIGWRADAKRIVVWIGDMPGHDPICQAVSGLTYDITEHSATTKLQARNIFVLAISTGAAGPTSGLNGDPVPVSGGTVYQSLCGVLGGTAGQGSRVAAATGGTYRDGITPATVVQTIIDLGTAGITTLGNVSLVPDHVIAPFVQVSPAGGYGPFTGAHPDTLDFQLHFPGATSPAGAPVTREIAVEGDVDVVVDGVKTGSTRVKITVPDLAGRYRVQSTLSDLYLQLDDPNWTGDGANVDQNDYTGLEAQHWELVPVSGGGYRIKNCDPARDRYLEVVGMSSADGAEVLTRSDPSGPHKEWLLIPVGSPAGGAPVFRIQNLHTGKVLDIRGGSTERDAPVFQYFYWGDYPTYRQNHNQHWRLERV
ncbi:RICIN domain-containing protein [Saccharothrix obliqua]|uniref:RICIN domain-containing protein n=1 Tax=Saccharothrix obliqua TaxID=2861747 RepID=UPI001C5FC23B|nr:RICIN domain-containing protein [Saccharothrix obliqua]MBW4717196.1 RICIN domain-containing protein [Saccharothrix obliqua]